ncbi:hypothetical protein [Rhizobium sp. FKY42]|uniref:hypothetical protein n=1 Tax=Rhizobium sp. FKY42 TaxID=2562310 RepID=UPI0010BF6C9D|nr:hypothetical protein [Rhizobium sp. FKY42]
MDAALAALDGSAAPVAAPGGTVADQDIAPSLTWQSIARYLPSTLKLDTIEKLFSTVPSGKTETWETWSAEVKAFWTELAQLSVFLESETGLEAWLLAFCDAAFLRNGRLDADLLKGTRILEDEANPDPSDINKATDVYSQFKQFIEGDFNAAESVRRDFGKRIIGALIGSKIENGDALEGRLSDSLWLKRRVHRAKPPAILDDLLDVCLPLAGFEVVPETLRDVLLEHVFERRVAQITGKTPSGMLFRPDATPQPLPIQITETADPTAVEMASARISGLGFFVRAVSGGVDETVHASLAALVDRKDPKIVIDDRTVLPTLPALNNGASGIFVNYEGVPFATQNRPLPGRGGAEMSPDQIKQQQLAKLVRGYQLAEAKYNGDFPPLPALAYGRRYGITAFWLPGSGALPAALRGVDNNPYLPAPLGNPPNAAVAAFIPATDALQPYLRRTAVSDMQFARKPAEKDKFSIPSNVFPLAKDDPRLVLENIVGGQLHLNLFRLGDGTGGVNSDVTEIKLHAAAISGKLRDDQLEIKQVQAIEGVFITTSVKSKALTDQTLTITLDKMDDPSPCWLRLTWKEGLSEPGGLSFSDPSSDHAQGSADRAGAVLLLSPPGKGWMRRSTEDLTIETPRVSYADFECWARNIDLWNQTARDNSDDTKKSTAEELDRQKKLFTALSWAQALFEGAGHAYAEKIRKLPDPAVKAVMISVAASDQIFGAVESGGRYLDRVIEINPYDPTGLTIPTSFALTSNGSQRMGELSKRIEELCKLVDDILARAQIQLTITCEAGSKSGIVLDLPEGWVHRVLVAPAVLSQHFESEVFDDRMKTLAVGRHGKWTIFDGAKFFVETATSLAGATMAPGSLVSASSADVSRSFRLELRPRPEDRIYGSARVATQRWRATGQPIYHWIDPVPKGAAAAFPVLPINVVQGEPGAVGEVNRSALADFEADAFFGVSDEIGDIKDNIRIIPRPAATTLDQFSWPEHSATYYRHRVTLHSRYGGIITDPRRRSTNLFVDDDKWAAARTVILAAPSVANITRPQVRAFFPTLRNIPGSPGKIAPVACVLSEPPFYHFGLADRIDADLKMINTYKFKSIEDEAPKDPDRLQLDQLRKEIGPDPLLSYFPVGDARSRAVSVAVEGPVGLHFDQPNTELPIYSNSQFMLHFVMPEAINEPDANLSEMEESFVGLALSRYADPCWSWMPGETDVKQKTLSRFDASWVLIDQSFTLNCDGKTCVAVDVTGGILTIDVAHEALFVDGISDSPVELYKGEAVDAALMIRPVGDGRYILGVYQGHIKILEGDNNARGRPQLRASVIVKTTGELEPSADLSLRRTRQSESSFVEWVRTGRDMGNVMTRLATKPDSDENLTAVAGLTAILIQEKKFMPAAVAVGEPKGSPLKFVEAMKTEALHIMSPVATRRYPLHVHRHLALIVRKPSKQIGHQVDLFESAFLLDGGGGTSLDLAAESSLLLAEFETRAEILHIVGKTNEAIRGLEQFASGYFDLVSSKSGDIRKMRFHFRAANEPVDISDLVIAMKAQNDGSTAMIEFPTGLGAATLVRSFELLFYSKRDASNKDVWCYEIRWPRRFVAGEKNSVVRVEPKITEILRASAITLSVQDAQGPKRERWFDVSLLHSVKDVGLSVDSFDFDWIFGVAKGRLDLPAALSPEALNKLPEAQGRLVGLSDPINVITVTE